MKEFKFAVFLDGGFIIKKLGGRLKRKALAADVVDFTKNLCSSTSLKLGTLHRIYFYHAPPYSAKIVNPFDGQITNYGTTTTYIDGQKLIQQLELSENFAVRLGELNFQGWKLRSTALTQIASSSSMAVTAKDIQPELKQKGVDLRIGLDIAAVALKKQADAVVLVTGDADLIPAMKFARREGLRVYLVPCNHGVIRELKVHADEIINI